MQMFFVVIIALLSSAMAEEGAELVMCDGLVFHGVYYDKELLFEGLGRPYNLMMHR